MIKPELIIGDLAAIRNRAPLVHNITNYVVMNNTANALLAIGASPVMAHAVDEINDMVSIASALVINMGTLSPLWVEAMLMAGETANKKGIPVIFDPVGVGATAYRNITTATIIETCGPDIIRGNASEIMALVNGSSGTKGVDSTMEAEKAIDSAIAFAKQLNCIVVISGPEDYITNGSETLIVKNGSPLMPKVTGMGCTATAITGAFAAVNHNYLNAAAHAMAVMGITGELAAHKAHGPGSLQVQFMDTLYNLTPEDIERTFKCV